MRKRLVIAGHAAEGLELIPLLEANPDVEVYAVVTDDRDAALAGLRAVDPRLATQLADRVGTDLEAALAAPGLVAVIDADAAPEHRRRLAVARDVQLTTPMLARLLYAFGPADAFSQPDLLKALREVLDSYHLTLDRRALLNRVLQIAVTATGADRGSLMLWEPESRSLRVEVAIGIEAALIPDIRLASGEGIAGRAFAAQRSIVLHGRADRTRYQITRERSDVESAISVPLLHGDDVIGVLNLSHGHRRDAFGSGDVAFVEELARLDARLIARAEEYHHLLRESEALRAESQVRHLLGERGALGPRLEAVCGFVAEPIDAAVARLYMLDAGLKRWILQASSDGIDPLGVRERLAPGQGVVGRAGSDGAEQVLSTRSGSQRSLYAALPLLDQASCHGVLVVEGSVDEDALDARCERLRAIARALGPELLGALRAVRLEREARRGAWLAGLFGALSECSAAELPERVTAAAASLLEAQDAVLRLADLPDGRFRIAAWTGVGQWRRDPMLAVERTLARTAIRQRRAVRVADLGDVPEFGAAGAAAGTALVQPLLREGRVVGCLSVLGKVSEQPWLGECFDAEDEVALLHLTQHVGAVLGERPADRSESDRFDADTGLPSALHLRERLETEIERSRAGGHGLVLLELRVEGVGEAGASAPVARAIAAALRHGLRPFDLVARTGPAAFAALVPEPESDVPELLAALGRAVREALGDIGPRVELRSGYAVFPEHGRDAEALLARSGALHVETL